MKKSDDKRTENRKNLLNDTDFVTLMEAEFTASSESNNVISKQRVWNKILATTFESNPNNSDTLKPKRKNIYSIAVALLIGVIALPLFFSRLNWTDTQTDLDRVKGINEIMSVNLAIYTLDNTGKLTHSTGKYSVGTTLLFKVYSTQKSVVSVVSSKNGSLSNNGTVYKLMPSSSDQLLSKNEKIYAYMIEPIDKILQFCVVAAENESRLLHHLSDLTSIWAQLPASSCATINVSNSLD